ncbi:uncharacterized protein METZ01_LOCUS221794, partial [marine metagenome]
MSVSNHRIDPDLNCFVNLEDYPI